VMDDLERAFANEIADDPELLRLPAGTVIHPNECGFELPDGRYLRIYEYGVREEEPDGRPASGQSHVERQQLIAWRCRVGGNPYGYGHDSAPGYTTVTSVQIVLPETLSAMDDHGLLELSHLIRETIVQLEMRFDLEGDPVLEDLPEGAQFAHVIDLSVVGPYGGAPLP
jgi:hypothetical protein